MDVLQVDCGSAVDDDFGDFMGPGGGDLESGGLTTTHQTLGPSENLAETQSVARYVLGYIASSVQLLTAPNYTH